MTGITPRSRTSEHETGSQSTGMGGLRGANDAARSSMIGPAASNRIDPKTESSALGDSQKSVNMSGPDGGRAGFVKHKSAQRHANAPTSSRGVASMRDGSKGMSLMKMARQISYRKNGTDEREQVDSRQATEELPEPQKHGSKEMQKHGSDEIHGHGSKETPNAADGGTSAVPETIVPPPPKEKEEPADLRHLFKQAHDKIEDKRAIATKANIEAAAKETESELPAKTPTRDWAAPQPTLGGSPTANKVGGPRQSIAMRGKGSPMPMDHRQSKGVGGRSPSISKGNKGIFDPHMMNREYSDHRKGGAMDFTLGAVNESVQNNIQGGRLGAKGFGARGPGGGKGGLGSSQGLGGGFGAQQSQGVAGFGVGGPTIGYQTVQRMQSAGAGGPLEMKMPYVVDAHADPSRPGLVLEALVGGENAFLDMATTAKYGRPPPELLLSGASPPLSPGQNYFGQGQSPQKSPQQREREIGFERKLAELCAESNLQRKQATAAYQNLAKAEEDEHRRMLEEKKRILLEEERKKQMEEVRQAEEEERVAKELAELEQQKNDGTLERTINARVREILDATEAEFETKLKETEETITGRVEGKYEERIANLRKEIQQLSMQVSELDIEKQLMTEKYQKAEKENQSLRGRLHDSQSQISKLQVKLKDAGSRRATRQTTRKSVVGNDGVSLSPKLGMKKKMSVKLKVPGRRPSARQSKKDGTSEPSRVLLAAAGGDIMSPGGSDSGSDAVSGSDNGDSIFRQPSLTSVVDSRAPSVLLGPSRQQSQTVDHSRQASIIIAESSAMEEFHPETDEGINPNDLSNRLNFAVASDEGVPSHRGSIEAPADDDSPRESVSASWVGENAGKSPGKEKKKKQKAKPVGQMAITPQTSTKITKQKSDGKMAKQKLGNGDDLMSATPSASSASPASPLGGESVAVGKFRKPKKSVHSSVKDGEKDEKEKKSDKKEKGDKSDKKSKDDNGEDIGKKDDEDNGKREATPKVGRKTVQSKAKMLLRKKSRVTKKMTLGLEVGKINAAEDKGSDEEHGFGLIGSASGSDDERSPMRSRRQSAEEIKSRKQSIEEIKSRKNSFENGPSGRDSLQDIPDTLQNSKRESQEMITESSRITSDVGEDQFRDFFKKLEGVSSAEEGGTTSDVTPASGASPNKARSTKNGSDSPNLVSGIATPTGARTPTGTSPDKDGEPGPRQMTVGKTASIRFAEQLDEVREFETKNGKEEKKSNSDKRSSGDVSKKGGLDSSRGGGAEARKRGSRDSSQGLDPSKRGSTESPKPRDQKLESSERRRSESPTQSVQKLGSSKRGSAEPPKQSDKKSSLESSRRLGADNSGRPISSRSPISSKSRSPISSKTVPSPTPSKTVPSATASAEQPGAEKDIAKFTDADAKETSKSAEKDHSSSNCNFKMQDASQAMIITSSQRPVAADILKRQVLATGTSQADLEEKSQSVEGAVESAEEKPAQTSAQPPAQTPAQSPVQPLEEPSVPQAVFGKENSTPAVQSLVCPPIVRRTSDNSSEEEYDAFKPATSNTPFEPVPLKPENIQAPVSSPTFEMDNLQQSFDAIAPQKPVPSPTFMIESAADANAALAAAIQVQQNLQQSGGGQTATLPIAQNKPLVSGLVKGSPRKQSVSSGGGLVASTHVGVTGGTGLLLTNRGVVPTALGGSASRRGSFQPPGQPPTSKAGSKLSSSSNVPTWISGTQPGTMNTTNATTKSDVSDAMGHTLTETFRDDGIASAEYAMALKVLEETQKYATASPAVTSPPASPGPPYVMQDPRSEAPRFGAASGQMTVGAREPRDASRMGPAVIAGISTAGGGGAVVAGRRQSVAGGGFRRASNLPSASIVAGPSFGTAQRVCGASGPVQNTSPMSSNDRKEPSMTAALQAPAIYVPSVPQPPGGPPGSAAMMTTVASIASLDSLNLSSIVVPHSMQHPGQNMQALFSNDSAAKNDAITKSVSEKATGYLPARLDLKVEYERVNQRHDRMVNHYKSKLKEVKIKHGQQIAALVLRMKEMQETIMNLESNAKSKELSFQNEMVQLREEFIKYKNQSQEQIDLQNIIIQRSGTALERFKSERDHLWFTRGTVWDLPATTGSNPLMLTDGNDHCPNKSNNFEIDLPVNNQSVSMFPKGRTVTPNNQSCGKSPRKPAYRLPQVRSSTEEGEEYTGGVVELGHQYALDNIPFGTNQRPTPRMQMTAKQIGQKGQSGASTRYQALKVDPLGHDTGWKTTKDYKEPNSLTGKPKPERKFEIISTRTNVYNFQVGYAMGDEM